MARAPRSRDVLEILMEIGGWQAFVGPTGVQLYRIPNSTGTGTYTVSPTSCTCPLDQYRRRGQICKHRRALALALAIQHTLNQLRKETHDHTDVLQTGSGTTGTATRPAR